MLHVACATEYFPLTLPLSLTERMPRILCGHCAPEPTPSPSQEGSNTDLASSPPGRGQGWVGWARFMGRERQAFGWCVTNGCRANSGTGVIERLWTILPLLKGEGRGEGEPREAPPTVRSV
jgi:hypothetical protein